MGWEIANIMLGELAVNQALEPQKSGRGR